MGVNYVGNESAADQTVAAVEAAGGKAVAIRGDVASEAGVIAKFDATRAAFGGLDGMVNNAGIVAPTAMLADMPAERMRRLFDVSVRGAFLCAREAARRLSTKRGRTG